MRHFKGRFALAALVLAVLAAWACAPAEEEQKVTDSGEDWVAIGQAKADLDAKRTELAELRAGQGTDAGGEAADEELTPEQLQAKITDLEHEINELAIQFTGQLVTYINSQNITVGGEMTANQRQAIDWKVDEDMVVAQEYIDKGGDYQRAIDIYNQSLLLAPGNAKLEQAIADTEANRYMTEERFAQVKKKMTQSQVRDLLGQPKLSNIREFETGVVGWFYKKEDGGAAGVFFRKNRRDEYEAYEVNFTAIERQVVGSGDDAG